MKIKLSRLKFLLTGFLLLNTSAFSQDPNFYIFLCFGQSNMEGYPGTIQNQDKTVDSRFRVLEATDCSNLGRTKGKWYTAVPPLCRCYSGLTPADYFGRTLVANLPDSIKVGVINVSVGGCAIELFDKTNYPSYVATAPDWMKNIINAYGGNPYGYLVDLAKLAQKDGVIKGILLHQGESNTNDSAWPSKVKGVYDSLLYDLGLSADSIPLLAGEVVNADQGGVCASMNSIIATLPHTVPNSYVISSKGCTDTTDNLHFNAAGYRELGRRYAGRMLSMLGYEPAVGMESECTLIGKNWEIKADSQASNGKYVTVKAGLNSTSAAPADDASAILFPITLNAGMSVDIFARLNCPTGNDNSFWVKMDDGNFVKREALTTSGWQWKNLITDTLTEGDHILTIAYCEDGAKLDKICVAKYGFVPTGVGSDAINVCTIDTTTTGVLNLLETPYGYALSQNYPNPFNPATTITFTLPEKSFVTLKIYDALGREVSKLVSGEMLSGTHTQQWNAEGVPSGAYFYRLDVGLYSETKKLVLIK